jgi:hypothetical protein
VYYLTILLTGYRRYLDTSEGMWLARQRNPTMSMEPVPDVYGAVWGQGNGDALVRSIPLNVQELLLPSVHSYAIKAGVQQYKAWEIAGLI